MTGTRKKKLKDTSYSIEQLTKKFINDGGKIEQCGNKSNPIDHAKMLRTIPKD